MREDKFSIKRGSVECYKVRHSSGMYWADIVIDASGNAGRVQIASDYGSWEYYWGSCGCPFKQFLTQLGIDYVAGKFGEAKWLDLDATIKSYKGQVIEYRRDGSMSSSIARALFDEIKDLEEEYPNDESSFCVAMNNKEQLMKWFDYCPSPVHSISPQFRKFWEHVWPVFKTELLNEVSQELLASV